MNNEIAVQNTLPESIEKALINGDLSSLKVEERIAFYKHVCHSMGLNAATNPFAYIVLQNKMTLYAKKECTDQLRSLRRISINIVSREKMGDLYIVTSRASDPTGRHDESTGVVHIMGLKGDALSNALMKAETKSKRRVTLSFTGLSMLDESEIESIRGAQRVEVDYVAPLRIEPAFSMEPKSPPSPMDQLTFDRHNAKLVVWLKEQMKSNEIDLADLEFCLDALDGENVKKTDLIFKQLKLKYEGKEVVG